ncbi:uncharacterized protein B0H64DRAFT_468800 [Chaetomium fimeti]|uniref:Uncharacterized protein n=1 Tax=Chaetomium fimeti TaxID=1854472 RepID=A0AAE0LNH0_9PEZI|nr:hypothetical protein B0H64DRAFT_468800 [Chaetomium fimeti]
MRYSHVPDAPSVSQRLLITPYDGAACRAALRGEQVPLNLGNDVARAALEVFNRARNARRIMSNSIPPIEIMPDEAHYPYCIWYPDLADEATYRALFERYPKMRYQIGRACAVAGYDELYSELKILPDVSIAEEARENRDNAGAQRIYQQIMAAPTRYRVMDDGIPGIQIQIPPVPAVLNADTAVRATLDVRRQYCESFHPDNHFFNITEDHHIGETDAFPPPALLGPDDIALFLCPLKPDLPSMNKTLLTLHAAATGNIDRYAQLRRRDLQPAATRVHGVRFEVVCLARGCHASSGMAAWLASTPAFLNGLGLHERERVMLWRAIRARRIMDGVRDAAVFSGAVPDAELPYWIWRPALPPAGLLRELAVVRPVMRPQIVRACIAAGYKDVYDEVMEMGGPGGRVTPDRLMLREARRAGDHYFKEDLLRRGERLGVKRLAVCEGYQNWMDAPSPWEREVELGCTSLSFLRDSTSELHSDDGDHKFDRGFFDGFDVSLDKINFMLSQQGGPGVPEL